MTYQDAIRAAREEHHVLEANPTEPQECEHHGITAHGLNDDDEAVCLKCAYERWDSMEHAAQDRAGMLSYLAIWKATGRP